MKRGPQPLAPALRPESTDWRLDALCRGQDGRNGHVDFLEQPLGVQRRQCMACPVREACLRDALEVDAQLGCVQQAAGTVRGGLTALERAATPALRRAREAQGDGLARRAEWLPARRNAETTSRPSRSGEAS